MDLTKIKIKIGEAVWRGPSGKVHWVEREMVHEPHLDTLLAWTACGRSDVPANSAIYGHTWHDGSPVSCQVCDELMLVTKPSRNALRPSFSFSSPD